ncbi:MAG: OmpH family outer membrane protein [Candidatus Eisenbacteria bacterium]
MLKTARLVLLLFAASCSLAWGTLLGAELKVGFIDTERIFIEYKGIQEAQKQFDQEIQNWKAQATEMKNEIDKMRAEISSESERLRLSQGKLQERESELQSKIRAFEEFVQRIWSPGGELELKTEQLTKPVVVQIRAIVDKIAAEEDFSLILDAADGNIVFGDKALDLTDRVLEELGKME